MAASILSLLPLFLCLVLSAQAQDVLRGTVRDQYRQPVNDAYVINQTSGNHTHTNEAGRFSLAGTSEGDVVVITHIGFGNATLEITAAMLASENDVALQQEAFNLDQIVITNDLSSVHRISQIDLATDPVNSSQEILRKVPGLIIGQHAGGGKAEQLFLRGFDIDHGTDVAISVDGLPVNMVSHAHGQGYADLHFLIPETIEKIDYGKGPYYADRGNFATAGYVQFHTMEKPENSLVQAEYGRFNTLRLLSLVDLLGDRENHHAWLAGEYQMTDGPFESSQHFNRLNIMGKYTARPADDQKIGLSVSYFTSKWDASGQVPQRAVDSGLITRFGAIDDTEGGQTSRLNASVSYMKFLNESLAVNARAFYSRYNFELYSNFTFFLDDPENGDQIKQKETRDIAGLEANISRAWNRGRADVSLRGGAGLRYDKVAGNELSHTVNRQTTLERISWGDVDEFNGYAFAQADIHLGDFTISPGIRGDLFKFDYVNRLDTLYSTQSATRFIASPKLNLLYKPAQGIQLFVKSGMGFHSNDTRVVVARNGEEILPYAAGVDVGLNTKPVDQLYLSAAFWYLFLQQEFVYVGDAGIVEPSGRSRRLGVDLSVRYQPLSWMFLEADVNYAFARAMDEPSGENYIPLAPDLTSAGGVSFAAPFGLTAGIKYRYVRHRPANEDNSIVADGYFIADLNAVYERPRWKIGLVIENLFNSDWNETQFATESRLQFEEEPVEEIHFTPGAPIFVKGFIGFKF